MNFLSKIKSIFKSKKPETLPEEVQETVDGKNRETVKQKVEKKKIEVEEKIDKLKEEAAEQKSEVKDIIDYVIEPEERTLKNYLSLKFWREKSKQYRKVKKKEKDDINVYQILRKGASPTIEYYILTILSCIIATAGLIQGSTAVVIGAMIVAPLMTPILAFSLAVIWGDINFMKISIQSIVKGTILTIAISAVIAYIVPLPGYSQEILSRTKPTLFDILVAIPSGIVGAYGYANKKISNTIVGIAIAVALMPPLCTIGIGIGTFNRSVATGAFMLFTINLVSIALAGAVVFWVMKIHPILADKEEVKKRALYQIILSLIILTSIAIPVGIYMYHGYWEGEALRITRQTLESELLETSILSLKTEKTDSGYILNVTLTGTEQPDEEKIAGIKKELFKECGKIRRIRIRFLQSNILTE